MRKKNREGYIYEVVGLHEVVNIGSIVVMATDDNSDAPFFDIVKGSANNTPEKIERRVLSMSSLKQLYPAVEEKPVETIELMGRTYAKKDIEQALSTVKEI